MIQLLSKKKQQICETELKQTTRYKWESVWWECLWLGRLPRPTNGVTQEKYMRTEKYFIHAVKKREKEFRWREKRRINERKKEKVERKRSWKIHTPANISHHIFLHTKHLTVQLTVQLNKTNQRTNDKSKKLLQKLHENLMHHDRHVLKAITACYSTDKTADKMST